MCIFHVESEGKKGVKKRTIEFVPLYRKAELEASEEKMLEYLRTEIGLKEPHVLLHKIKTDTLFQADGFKMHLSGRTGKQLVFKGANQFLVAEDYERLLKKVGKVTEQLKTNKNYKINDYDGITEEGLKALYSEFLSKLQKAPYGNRLGTQAETLENGKEKFDKLSLENKCQVLSEILHLFQCNSSAADLSKLGGPGHGGILVLSNEITKCNKISIIHQSPAGIYEQEIDLKTL